MKKIFAYIIAIAAFVACTIDPAGPEPVVAAEGTVTVNFGVEIPDVGDNGTRAFADEPGSNIKNLYVAVFDDSGYLAEYKKCTCVDGYPTVSTNDSLSVTDTRKYSVVLSVSKTVPRIMHFIANGPDHVTFGSEEDVVASMTAHLDPAPGEIGPDCYWQRIELTNGVTYEPGTTELNAQSASELQHVGLIRNFAEFSIESEAANFELTCAKILMSPDMGYVAPYNKPKGCFVMDYAHKTVNQLVALGYIGSAPATARVSTDFTNPTAAVDGKVSQFMFEREKPTSAPACVVVGGHYNGSSDVQYYKVNLIDNEGEYYPIMRNFKYHVSISSVAAKGKSTIEEAYNSGGTGDISVTFEYEDLTNVSNGSSKMLVQYVEKIVVSDAEFELRYKFVPDITAASTTANDQAPAGSQGVQIKLQDPSELILGASIDHITVGTTDNDDGSRTIRVKPVAPSAFQKTQKIMIIGTAIVDGSPKTIQRHVNIIVRERLVLTAHCDPSTVAQTAGSAVDLHITLPKGLRQSMFPLQLFIEAENLSITPAGSDNLPVESGLSYFDSDKPGYHFVKTVDWDDYFNGGEIIDDSSYNTDVVCHFKTNKATSATRILVSNEYFANATTFFTNPGVSLGLKFTSLAYTDIRSDGTVDFSFNMENTDPVTVTLSNLVPTIDENSLVHTSTEGVYTFTPAAAGPQTFKLKTTGGGDGTYTTSLESNMYEPASKKGAYGIVITLPNPWHTDAAVVSGSTHAPAVGFQSTLTAYVHFNNTSDRNVKFFVGATELSPSSSAGTTTIDGLEYYTYTINYTPTAQGYYKFRVEAWNTGAETAKKVLERTGAQGLGVWNHYWTIDEGTPLTSATFSTSQDYVIKNVANNTYLYYDTDLTVTSSTSTTDNGKYFRFGSTSSKSTIKSVASDTYLRVTRNGSSSTLSLNASGTSLNVTVASGTSFQIFDNNAGGVLDANHYRYWVYQPTSTTLGIHYGNGGGWWQDPTYNGTDSYWQIIPILNNEHYAAPM